MTKEKKEKMKAMTRNTVKTLLLFVGVILLLIPFSGQVYGQAIPAANLQQLAFIGIPNWITSAAVGPTANVASYDVPSFNRVTGVMYITDRPNFGVTTIDAKTFTYLGTIELPGCRTKTGCSVSGALVAPDLQKLIATDRLTGIYVYDLRVPGSTPAVLVGPPGQDELDYDPINQRAYIGNTVSDFAVTVVDVKNSRVLGSIPLPAAPEQPRFNPVDGMIYVNVPDAHQVAVVDPQQGAFGAVVNNFNLPTGCSNAIDIDPVTNTAFLGCSAGQQAIMDLRSGAIVTAFPLTGTDIGMFNPHNRRWYMASDNRTAVPGVTFPCSKASDGRTGVLAVYSNSPTPNTLVGVACGGRGHAVAGVDPLNNNIYYAQVQYPADPASADTGRPGILVFHDPAPDVIGVPAGTVQSWTTATLATTGGSGVTGTVAISLRRRNMFVDAGMSGLPAGSTTTSLVVETTAGHETVPCGVNGSGQGFCQADLIGDPLIGAPVNVGSGGNRVASGTLTSVATFPTFIPTD